MNRYRLVAATAGLAVVLAGCTSGHHNSPSPSCDSQCQSEASAILDTPSSSDTSDAESSILDPCGGDTECEADLSAANNYEPPPPDDETTDTTASSVRLGEAQQVVLDDSSLADITITQVKKLTLAPYTDSGYYFEVHVKVQCLAGTCEVNPLYLEAVDSTGKQYDVDLGSARDELGSPTLNEGHYTEGDVVFKGSKSTGWSEVDYTDAFGTTAASWTA